MVAVGYVLGIAIVDGISYRKSIRHLKKLEWDWRGMLLLLWCCPTLLLYSCVIVAH